jgi:hypothetical protein
MQRDHLQDLGVDGKVKLKRIENKYDVMVLTGLIWISTGTSGGVL